MPNILQQKAEDILPVHEEIGLLAVSSKAQIEALLKEIEEISMTTKVLVEISEQSALPAADALLEANRAGKVGKRFVVTANEMNNLTRQATLAAGEMKANIGSVHNSIKNATADISRIIQSLDSLKKNWVFVIVAEQEVMLPV